MQLSYHQGWTLNLWNPVKNENGLTEFYIEILIPKVMILGGGALGGD